MVTKAIWADKNGLVSGRLAFTSSKTKCRFWSWIFQLIRMFFDPKNLKSENNKLWFKPWFNILLHTQSIATVDSQCLEYLACITLTRAQQLALKGSIWGHMYISKDHKKDKAHLWIAGYFFNVLGGVFLWTKIYKSMVIFDTRQKITDVVSYLFFFFTNMDKSHMIYVMFSIRIQHFT